MLFFKSVLFALPFVASIVTALPAGTSTDVEKRDIDASKVKSILANLNGEVASYSKVFTKQATVDQVAPALEAINRAIDNANQQLRQPLKGKLSYGDKMAVANSLAGVITSVVKDLSNVNRQVLYDSKIKAILEALDRFLNALLDIHKILLGAVFDLIRAILAPLLAILVGVIEFIPSIWRWLFPDAVQPL